MSRWLQRQGSDTWVAMARKKGYMCRSAFKLTEIDDKFQLFTRSTAVVVDLGSSPGSWCQVIRERVPNECVLVGVDKNPLQGSVPGTIFIQGNFLTLDVQRNLTEQLGKLGVNHDVDVVTSDMCPDRMGLSGDFNTLVRLNLDALTFALNNLRIGGHFVCKTMGGRAIAQELYDTAKQNFIETFSVHPEAVRAGSAESFLVCKGKLAAPKVLHEYGARKVDYGLDDWPGQQRTTEYQQRRTRQQQRSPPRDGPTFGR